MSHRSFYGMRRQLSWFANWMERKLQENDHKRGWQEMTLRQLLKRLNVEVRELERAILNNKSDVIEEAADVANFAMMIADNFANGYGLPEQKKKP